MKHKQQGLSLIELMISLTLGIVLMTGVMQMFLTSRVTYSTQQAISRIQESGRMAIDMIAQEVRMAGYMGCVSQNADIMYGLDDESDPDYKFLFSEGIRGYTVDNDFPLSGDITPEDGTEVLVLRRASSQTVSLVEDTNATPNANIKVQGTVSDSCLMDGQLCGDTVALITDCTQGRIFRATNVSNDSGEQTIAHAKNGGPPSNQDTKLGGQEFGKGAKLMAFNTISYFIKDSSFAPDGAVVTTRSLWRKVGERDPVELIEGVEDMAVHYGVDTDGDDVPDTYREVGSMSTADWAEVKAVRLHLLMQSADENVVPEDQTLSFAGESRTFTDGRMRQVFTTTIGIRGRI